ncbi:MAG: hypothetical protein IJL56_10720 [Bacteroidales bacterium]|nr:hypothetical protein [Bacteroidales bacterium]
MKKILVSSLLLILPVLAFAQNELARIERELGDSVVYVLPAFQKGKVIFKNGEFATGDLNISIVDQSLRFKDEGGQILSVDDNSSVDRVTIGPMLFLHLGKDYAGVVDSGEEVILCLVRKLEFKRDEKTGAFGMKSETTNITRIGSMYDNGNIYDINLEAGYKIREIPVLVRKGRQFAFNRKSLEKLFPDKKAVLAEYLQSNNVDFESAQDAAALFSVLK